MRLSVNRAGTEEHGDLHETVRHDVEHGPGQRRYRSQCCPEHDVGQLADCRIGEAGLQVVLRECDDGRGDEGERGRVHQPHGRVGLIQEVDAEHVDYDLEHGEHARALARRQRLRHGGPVHGWLPFGDVLPVRGGHLDHHGAGRGERDCRAGGPDGRLGPLGGRQPPALLLRQW